MTFCPIFTGHGVRHPQKGLRIYCSFATQTLNFFIAALIVTCVHTATSNLIRFHLSDSQKMATAVPPTGMKVVVVLIIRTRERSYVCKSCLTNVCTLDYQRRPD